MSWKDKTTVVEKRLEFVKLCDDGRYTVSSLCERFGVSRKNGYKWLQRYREEGIDGLKDKRRAPRSQPFRISDDIEEALLAERDAHPHWGPRKILAVLRRDAPDEQWPVASTVYDVLKRNGRIKSQRRRHKHQHPGKPVVEMDRPNSVWCIDFKGQFKLGNGQWCYPLTVTDGFSRALLCAHALTSTKLEPVRRVFIRLFKKYGLPEVILSDNGTPFASTGIRGLSRLSVWWIRLGIRHVRTEPSSPEQNGRHERMHRTLKAETTKPPKQTMKAQQREFDRFQHEYNCVRPHEALGQETPISRYAKSPRQYPKRLDYVDYPRNFLIRLVSASGEFCWRNKHVFLSTALAGQHVGLEETDDGIWSIYFASEELGRLDVRTNTVK